MSELIGDFWVNTISGLVVFIISTGVMALLSATKKPRDQQTPVGMSNSNTNIIQQNTESGQININQSQNKIEQNFITNNPPIANQHSKDSQDNWPKIICLAIVVIALTALFLMFARYFYWHLVGLGLSIAFILVTVLRLIFKEKLYAILITFNGIKVIVTACISTFLCFYCASFLSKTIRQNVFFKQVIQNDSFMSSFEKHTSIVYNAVGNRDPKLFECLALFIGLIFTCLFSLFAWQDLVALRALAGSQSTILLSTWTQKRVSDFFGEKPLSHKISESTAYVLFGLAAILCINGYILTLYSEVQSWLGTLLATH